MGEELTIHEIMKILPHRYPFLLVDKVLDYDLEKGYLIGQKNLTMNEFYFQGHFPGNPIMPGVLVLEALAQASGIFVWLKGHQEKIAYLLNLADVKFRRPILPGDRLELRCEGLHLTGKGGRFSAKAEVKGQVAAEAVIGFVLQDKETEPSRG